MTHPLQAPLAAPLHLPLGPSLEGQNPEGTESGAQEDRGADLLARVVPGDPLGVRKQVARRLRERCFLLDPHGVSVQVLASIAENKVNGLASLQGGVDLDSGMGELVRSTVDRVIDDCVAGRLEVPVAGLPRGGIQQQLAHVLKIRHTELKRACDRFNRLPSEARRAFHALVLQRRSLESACRRSAANAEAWSQGAARGLRHVIGSRREGVGGDEQGVADGLPGLGSGLLVGRGGA